MACQRSTETAILNLAQAEGFFTSSIHNWSISHILEHEFFCLGRLGSKEKRVDLSFSEQLLRVVFSTFCRQKET